MVNNLRPWIENGRSGLVGISSGPLSYESRHVNTWDSAFRQLTEEAKQYQLWRYGSYSQWNKALEYWNARGVDPWKMDID